MTDQGLTGARKPVMRLWGVLQRVWNLIGDKNLGLISAGVAFWAILSVFPGLAATIALWGVIGDPELALQQLAAFQAVLPGDVYTLIAGQLDALSTADGLTLGWASVLSFVLALWSARAGVAALIQGLNAIHGVPNRSGVAHAARALFLTLCLIGVVLVAMACIVVMPVVLAFFPLGPWASAGVEALRWGVGLAVLLVGFSLLHRVGPNLRTRMPGMVSAGTVFAAAGWVAASVGFSIYLQNFGTYNEVYGSIGAVMAMLMWLFLSAFMVLLGAALDVSLRQVT
ncbi:YihY/virulence factor BrkB family protein [uncultured Tateyamaria sp.]|uniref:YihY/virulence factor BrkB family protein n=1 Tax=Tateyamaria sp. 1078 TaxID=3417464 RepID=UPI002630FBE0|nr:YihY/virulence factor BrkB family protein [uncultured Tateyamaria sp.]